MKSPKRIRAPRHKGTTGPRWRNRSKGRFRNTDGKFLTVSDAAFNLHRTLLAMFKKHVASHQEESGRELVEGIAACKYDYICTLVTMLLQWTNHALERIRGNRDMERHHEVQFHGIDVDIDTKCQAGENPKASLATKMRLLRSKLGKCGLAREALCALVATLASRREMCWLDGYDGEVPAKGYFAHVLVEPSATFRLSYRTSATSALLRPAAVMITSTLPLQEALEKMDLCGPFPMQPRLYYNARRDRQVSLQELSPSGEKQATSQLSNDSRIHQLIRSKTRVVYLDAYAALAPRRLTDYTSFSAIVQGQLMRLLRQAKENAHAVVFQLGGDDPELLAQKIYLRPAFTRWGLRCGYMRWRESSQEPWAKEKPWSGRPCIGLQLP